LNVQPATDGPRHAARAPAMHFFDAEARRDAAQLRRAYLRLALQYHPDKVCAGSPDAGSATRTFQEIQGAYEELAAALEGKAGKGPRVRSAFAAACELGDLQAVKAMLRRRPAVAWEPDELGVTPLMFAAAGGAIEVCEALLSAQAALDTCNPLGWTALTWAALRGHAQCCRWLMERKAPLKDNDLIAVLLAAFFSMQPGIEQVAVYMGVAVSRLATMPYAHCDAVIACWKLEESCGFLDIVTA
ncbi:unnamed protein product, partial [Effrenium voratum]